MCREGLGRNEVAVGDTVGFFDRDGNERYGKVTRLNQKKTVTLDCDNGKWRVPYKFLFKSSGSGSRTGLMTFNDFRPP